MPQRTSLDPVTHERPASSAHTTDQIGDEEIQTMYEWLREYGMGHGGER
jgi:hypothetical protein